MTSRERERAVKGDFEWRMRNGENDATRLEIGVPLLLSSDAGRSLLVSGVRRNDGWPMSSGHGVVDEECAT